MKTTLGTIFVTSYSATCIFFFFFLIFQNQSAVGDVIQRIKKRKPKLLKINMCILIG